MRDFILNEYICISMCTSDEKYESLAIRPHYISRERVKSGVGNPPWWSTDACVDMSMTAEDFDVMKWTPVSSTWAMDVMNWRWMWWGRVEKILHWNDNWRQLGGGKIESLTAAAWLIDLIVAKCGWLSEVKAQSQLIEKWEERESNIYREIIVKYEH